jgi:translocation and assembly module TamB
VSGQLGRTNLSISARSVGLPVEEDINVTFDADLKLAVPPPGADTGELPTLSGAVNVLSATYEKPMNITADITNLTARGAKTAVEGYDETKNNLKLDLLIRSSKPLKVENELVTASLMIDPAGLRISGTDQRYGAVGTVALRPGGRVFLRRNEFDITQGLVRFNDPTRLKPEVDMSAVTEYRRYEDRGATEGQTQSTDVGSSASKAAGNSRIHLRAYGPPDDLKVDLNSDPPLAQDDIFLLLTVGLTRTELDQTRNSGVGSSVALEALGSLSGAESAVTDVVPVDEFRFGSSYSSRSGRTEPTVTIGKRLSRRIRASVTTSLSDTSEVRSNVEYRATDSLSVEGSFDNAGDVATATGGNLGGDVRWRLEFQ